MAKKEYKKGVKKTSRRVIAAQKIDGSDFGLYLNTRHIQDSLGISNTNIHGYMQGKFSHLHGYVMVMVDVPVGKINFVELEKNAKAALEVEKNRNRLKGLLNQEIASLDDQQISKIVDIISEKK